VASLYRHIIFTSYWQCGGAPSLQVLFFSVILLILSLFLFFRCDSGVPVIAGFEAMFEDRLVDV